MTLVSIIEVRFSIDSSRQLKRQLTRQLKRQLVNSLDFVRKLMNEYIIT
jgi:hypothetical protein